MSNKLNSIPDLITIEKKNLPNVTFFFRHINDLDFCMPILLFASNPNIIFYQSIDPLDPRIKLLHDHGIKIEYLNNSLLDMFERVLDFLIALLIKSSFKKFANFIKLKVNIFICSILNWRLAHLFKLKNIHEHSNIFCFDHTSCMKSKSLIKVIRDKTSNQTEVNIISIPHGADIFKNRMIDYWQVDLASNKQNYYHFDRSIS